jgi:hypothetical protein
MFYIIMYSPTLIGYWCVSILLAINWLLVCIYIIGLYIYIYIGCLCTSTYCFSHIGGDFITHKCNGVIGAICLYFSIFYI